MNCTVWIAAPEGVVAGPRFTPRLIFPPALLACTALTTRLLSTCCSAGRSTETSVLSPAGSSSRPTPAFCASGPRRVTVSLSNWAPSTTVR